MFKPSFAVIVAAIALSGCASIVEGTEQSVLVQTVPAGGKCQAQRQGELLFTASDGQGVTLSKSRHGFTIRCELGALTGAAFVDSHVTTMGAASVAIDGGLTDYMTGALNAYPSEITVRLVPAVAK